MNRFSPEILLARLRLLPKPRRYLVAFSGGCDSVVLLHAMAGMRQALGVPLLAIHVDHGLNPASAVWADRCEAFCRERHVALSVHRLALRPMRGDSVEAAARAGRYRVLREAMQGGDAIVTAHQRDDQAETLLLFLLRGSGPRGLSSMPGARRFGPGLLLRPLLDFDRRELEAYARLAGLSWIEDESNQDERFDRNFLRRNVLPVVLQRWPAAVQTIARAASFCAEAEEAVGTLAARDVARIATGRVLNVSGLVALPGPRCRAALRHWFGVCGLPPPDHRKLAEILRQLETARPDAQPLVTWPGAEVRRWRGGLYAGKPLSPAPTAITLGWSGDCELRLPSALGTLSLERLSDPGEFEIRFRRGGETCRVGGRDRQLKKLLQTSGVPPWLRSRLPLVYQRNVLVCAADLFVCDGWPAALKLAWHRGSGWPDYAESLPGAAAAGEGMAT